MLGTSYIWIFINMPFIFNCNVSLLIFEYVYLSTDTQELPMGFQHFFWIVDHERCLLIFEGMLKYEFSFLFHQIWAQTPVLFFSSGVVHSCARQIDKERTWKHASMTKFNQPTSIVMHARTRVYITSRSQRLLFNARLTSAVKLHCLTPLNTHSNLCFLLFPFAWL